MAAHHTKDKGDLGVAKVFADLVEKGFGLLFPATEHAPFDLVAYDEAGRFIRVQVKYRSARRGVIMVEFNSTWSDRHGVHKRPMDKASVDVVAVYCPDVDKCFYVDPSHFGGALTLRLEPTKNRQQIGVLYADRFRQLPSLGTVAPIDSGGRRQVVSSTLVG
jgi:hypothetical protein